MSKHNDGGPAFPGVDHTPGYGNSVPTTRPNGETVWVVHNPGMTLRAYLIAHAPTEPWSWFQPVAIAKPEAPKYADDPSWNLTPTQIETAKGWRNDPCYEFDANREDSKLMAFVAAWRSYWRVTEDHNKLMKNQRDIQWPAFWADTMIEQMEKKA